MKAVRIYLPEDLERKFRRISMESYGYSHASLSRAAIEAVRSWVRAKEVTSRVKVPSDPVRAVRGILRSVKKGSVRLQHEAIEIRVKKTRG